MYTLYYSPHACSLAIHTIINLLGEKVDLVYSGSVENFAEKNPNRMVPVLEHNGVFLAEGAAIILYLLNKHQNQLFPSEAEQKQRALQNMMMANATLHPAYGRLFFLDAHVQDDSVKHTLFNAATDAINRHWQVVEDSFEQGPYLGGETLSPADVLLAVYSRWGDYFPVDIQLGPKTQKMIELVIQNPAFQSALQQQELDHKRHAA